MKLLVISEGLQSFVFDEAARLSARGIELHVVKNAREKNRELSGMKIHGVAGTMLRSVPFTLRHLDAILPMGIVHDPRKTLGLYRLGQSASIVAASENVDLIHAHFAYPEGCAGLIAKKDTGKPLVVTLHGIDILTEPQTGYGYRLVKRLDVLIRKVLREADVVIARSTATYREALKAGASATNVRLIHNGVDVNKFSPDADGDEIRNRHDIRDKRVVFALGWHVPRKGFEYLVRATPLVINYVKDVVFMFCGDGPQRGYLERLSRDLRVSDSVLFVGRIEGREVSNYYSACDVFVVPSVQEAFGLVVSEAMACGKPVIGTRVGGIPDQITDGVNGLLVNPRDPRELAAKIVCLLENPDLAIEMGRAGRRIVEERFDIENAISSILDVYHELVI